MEALFLERADELDQLASLTVRAAGGAGAVAQISGPPGIGKTALLEACSERARAQGLQVLCARAGERESDLPWGVVRRLFERELSSSLRDAAALEGAAALAAPALGFPDRHQADAGAVLHGLHWLTAGLAERQPLLLAVDDAHWCDQPSLRWLAYLSARVEELAVAVVLTSRSDLDLPGAAAVSPAPLSEAAVAELVAAALGEQPAPEFAAACHSASGGNPFLARELIAELADAEVEPAAGAAGSVASAAPASVTRAVQRRLAALSEPAHALGRAVAILGDGSRLRQAARLAGLEENTAAAAADELSEAAVLAPGLPLAFRHPLLREALYAGLAPVARTREHARAAALLAADGADDEVVAGHLLATEPGRDPEVVVRLRRAAAAALGRGAPESAVAQLRRALAEAPPQAQRADLLRELGEAELQVGDPTGAEHLAAALEACVEPRSRAHASLSLAQMMALSGRATEAVAMLDAARAAVDGADPELALRLEIAAIDTARQDYGTSAQLAPRVEAVRDRVHGNGPTERLLAVHMAMQSALSGDSAAATVALAELGLAEERLMAEHGAASPACYVGIHALVAADRSDLALTHLDAALEDARRRGSVIGFAIASLCRSHAHWARGAIPDAIADARAALECAESGGWTQMVPWTLGFLIDALLETGELEAATAELERSGLTGELPFSPNYEPLVQSRARLALARGDAASAERELLDLGPRLVEAGVLNPAMSPWRSTAARALAAQGREADARPLAEEELTLARAYGAPRSLAAALRAVGALEDGAERLALLEQAVAALDGSPADLERARCLLELGAALRRANRRADAREPLTAGLELAAACGASAIAARAATELSALGVRRRPPNLSGAAALTAGELRVARLAAAGATNREIAEALFVSLRTVETHLTHAYSKLGIAGRRELAGALT